MPPIIIAIATAAGIFAAARGVTAALQAHAEALRRQAEEQEARRRAAGPVKDLGSLEWDETAGVYRPRMSHPV